MKTALGIVRCFLVFLASGLSVLAQEDTLTNRGESSRFGSQRLIKCGEVALNEAKKAYENGEFEALFTTLNRCMETGFTDAEKVQAYRLMAMTSLAMDRFIEADLYVGLLLKTNPNFEPNVFDPPQFLSLVREVKSRDTKIRITSVSKKAEDLLEAPATVVVVTEEQIRNRGYVDLEAVLSDIPGFSISRTFGPTYSNIYQRGYRSNNTDRTLILVDGVEENDLWSNIAYFGRQYPITSVKRIEVVYGPASTMYGANAFVGVVNIITKDPDEYFKTDNPVAVKAHGGLANWNTKFADVTAALRVPGVSLAVTGRVFRSDEMDLSRFPDYDYSTSFYDNFDYLSALSVTRNASQFFRDNFSSGQGLDTIYTVERDARDSIVALRLTPEGAARARRLDSLGLAQQVNGQPVNFSNLTDTYFWGAKLKVSDFTLSFQTWRSQTGGTTYFTDNNEAGSRNGSQWIPLQTAFYLKYDKQVSDVLNFTNLTQYRSHELDDSTKAVYLLNYSNGSRNLARLVQNRGAVWINDYYYVLSRQLRNETKVLFTPTSNFDLITGLEVRSSQIQGDYLISGVPPAVDSGTSTITRGANNFDQLDIGVFIQGTYRVLEKLKLVGGFRYDYTGIREATLNETNPRLALVFSPSDFVFKGVFATAFKQASIFQRYATNPARRATNPELPSERVNNIELSGGYKVSREVYAEVAMYRSTYSGVVGTKPFTLPDGSVTTRNEAVGSLRIQGMQANVTANFSQYRFYANLTYTDPLNTEAGELRIGDIASWMANIGADAQVLPMVNLNLRVNYIGTRPTGPNTTVPLNPEGVFPSVFLLNGAVTFEPSTIIPGVSLQLLVNNITNLEYFDPGVRSADGGFYSARTPQRERNLTLRLMYDL